MTLKERERQLRRERQQVKRVSARLLASPETRQAVLVMHIEALCREHEIEWLVAPFRRPYGWGVVERSDDGELLSQSITTAPVRGPISYLVALHEIAHLVLDGTLSEEAFEEEQACWNWAFAQSVVPIGRRELQSVRRRLAGYRDASAEQIQAAQADVASRGEELRTTRCP